MKNNCIKYMAEHCSVSADVVLDLQGLKQGVHRQFLGRPFIQSSVAEECPGSQASLPGKNTRPDIDISVSDMIRVALLVQMRELDQCL